MYDPARTHGSLRVLRKRSEASRKLQGSQVHNLVTARVQFVLLEPWRLYQAAENRRLEPYTLGRVRIEEHDKERRLAQVSVVKIGRWKLKALHTKVGGCKQFKIGVGLREKKLLVAHRLRKGAKKRNHQSNEPSKCKIRQQTPRDSCQRVQQRP